MKRFIIVLGVIILLSGGLHFVEWLRAQPITPRGALYFIELYDTPNVWTSSANKVVTVNASGTGLEFTTGTGVSNVAYSSSWNGTTTTAPSMNAVYDQIVLYDTDGDGDIDTIDGAVGGGDIIAVGDGLVDAVFTAAGSGTTLWFEGATDDAYDVALTTEDPTDNATVTLRAATGTVLISGDTFQGDVTSTLGTSGTHTLTIAADAVALATDTTGNYVSSITNGSGITGGDGGSEGANLTIAATLGTAIDNTEITDGTILEADLDASNAPTDNYILSYNLAGLNFTWIVDDDVPESGDFGAAGDLEADGTISANAVALATDTTGNYVATIADAGSSTITVSNSGSENAAVTLGVAAYSITNLQVSSTLVSNLTDVTSTDSDYILIWDATDSSLKKVDMGEVRGTSSASVTDAVYSATWNGSTTLAPSLNAVYDYLVNFDADADGSFTDETWLTQWTGSASITTLGTIATGIWNAGAITSSGTIEGATLTEGGVGVPNVNDHLGVFSSTTSSQLAGVMSDETGAGSLVFGSNPTFTSSFWVSIEHDTNGPTVAFQRKRDGTPTYEVSDGDLLGNFQYFGTATATSNQLGAEIKVYVDGTPGVDDMPARIEFYTSPDGTATPVERMEIDNAGNIQLGTPGTNYVQVSSAGAVTFTGTGDIELPDDSVDIADLSATGTPTSSTYLRGDNTWATPTGTGSVTVSDAVYAATWNGSTTLAPSLNAVYDYLVNFDADADGSFTDETWLTQWTGSASITTLGTIATGTWAADDIALTTYTSGNYVATIADSGSSTFNVAGSGSEGATVTLELNQDSVDDEHINWGSGSSQVDLADIPGGTSGAYAWDFSAATITAPSRIAALDRHFIFNLFNPNSLYGTDTQICIKPTLPATITITQVIVTCDADPATELDMDLKFANAFIGLASSTLITALDTTNGATNTTSFTQANIPDGQCLYIEFGASPSATITQACVDIVYDYD